MAIDVRPPLSEAQRIALARALARAGIRVDGTPEAHRSAWWRTGIREAVAGNVVRGGVTVTLATDA